MDITKLREEFPREQVTFRPGSTNVTKLKAPLTDEQVKTAKGLPLAYIDARDVMDRLDEVCGAENWRDEYVFHGERTICKLSIRINNVWITKSDGAGDTALEGEKGGISDALKRAAVKWGIGRYIYKMRFKWCPLNKWKKFDDNVNLWNYLITDTTVNNNKQADIIYAEQVTKLLDITDGDAFKSHWGSEEAKNRRAELKKLSVKLYNQLVTDMQTQAKKFTM